MSDLQTALSSALKEWEPSTEGTVIEAATPAPTPKPTSRPNLTRDTFAMVRDNPGISRANAIERLQAMGHKPVSTSSILYQLVRARMIDEVDGTFSTKRKNYTSLTNALVKAPKGKRKTRAKSVPKVIEAAPEPQATPTPAPTPSPRRVSMNVDEWLDTVPLKTARQVYWKLHGIFGGQAL